MSTPPPTGPPPELPPGAADRLAALLREAAGRDDALPPPVADRLEGTLAALAHDRAVADTRVRELLAAEPVPALPAEVDAQVAAALAAAAAERGSEPRHIDDLAVRRLRSALAADDAGPLPADVEQRIVAALVAEGMPAPTPVAPAPHRRHLRLPAWTPERSRPRWVLVLAAAAAVVVLAGLGSVVVRAVRGSTPDESVAAISVGTSQHRYDAASLGAQARRLLDTPGTGASGGEAAAGPLATRAGVDACLRGLGLQGASAVAVDLATYDGRPAAVLVVTAGGRTSAWVVARSCSAQDPGTVRGDVPVP
ncbi:hypothetical protein [Lapillicoccus jejuensis]|uniref:Uncharacterized protein n=1 Tax=Lapillicoccus jejuensis TaxID=402171 RepID=A0A542DZJ3_9MICO|nr:hypothetical protein [Lapillicoccus jejuensis]TQJ08364.1 hypothetical protein FB458_1452 [Lapillicoccus jejuensis]